MGHSNRKIKNLMKRIYGNKCMFKASNVEEKLADKPYIESYKKFKQKKRYKGKKLKFLEERLTYHHLIHKSEGGSNTLENGALVGELPHRYMHSLPRDQEEIINNILREYKLNVAIVNVDDQLDIDAQQLEFTLDENNCDEIPAYNYKSEKEIIKQKKKRQEDKELTKLKQQYEDR